MLKLRILSAFGLFFAASFAVAAPSPLLITGAGATFPYPIYSKWFSEYRKVDSSVQINYQSIGSGGGIRQLLDNTIDFGASDAPMKDDEMAKAKSQVIHIPTVLGAVVLSYQLPEVKKPLRLSGEVIAEIFLGKIKKWNDPKIQALNPGVKLSDKQYIMVVHRSDGSGTTSIFTDYLSKVSSEWKDSVGAGKSVKWPSGMGGKGNEGVAGLIKQQPGSIGYMELAYAESNHLPVASIQNKAGEFIMPDLDSVSAAADGMLKDMPADFRTSITDAAGKETYPIAAFTYLLVYDKMPKEKGMKIVDFLNWAVGPGQSYAKGLSYAPLPKQLVAKVKAKIKTVQFE